MACIADAFHSIRPRPVLLPHLVYHRLMVDPAVVLPSFQSALRQGRIRVTPSPADPRLYLHQDDPAGIPRLTYVRLQKRTVTALVMFVPEEALDDTPTFGIGYAVPPLFRRKQRATELVGAALTDFHLVMAKAKIDAFCIQAIIGTTNIPSLKIANKLLSKTPTEVTEGASGERALYYVRRFITGSS